MSPIVAFLGSSWITVLVLFAAGRWGTYSDRESGLVWTVFFAYVFQLLFGLLLCLVLPLP